VSSLGDEAIVFLKWWFKEEASHGDPKDISDAKILVDIETNAEELQC
jgi:hypothetical protein